MSAQSSRSFLGPRYWPVWLGIGLHKALARLPYGGLYHLGRFIGRAFYHIAPGRRRIAAINLRLCLPQQGEAERQRMIKAHFESLGLTLVETALCWWAGDDKVRRLGEVDGLEHLHAALDKGHGAILLAAHFTPMELGLRMLAVAMQPLKVHPVYQIHDNPLMERFITGGRERHSGKSISRKDIRSMIRCLKQNKVVWYSPDQATSGKYSAVVPFFGVPASSHTATSRIAAMTGAPVIPFFARRLPGGQGYRVSLWPPLEDFPGDDPATDTARYHQIIERQVTEAPAQYWWVHRRFKGRGPGYPDVYAKGKG